MDLLRSRRRSLLSSFIIGLGAYYAILAIMFAGVNLAVYFFLSPLLILAEACRDRRQILITALAAALGSSVIAFHWVWSYDASYFPMVIAALTVFFVSLLGVNSLLQQWVGPRWRLLSLPGLWLVLMWAFSFTPPGNFWLDIAIFQPLAAPLIGIIGSAGITFLIVFNNVLWAEVVRTRQPRTLILASAVLTVLLACLAYTNLAPASEKSHRVALLQGNFSMDWEWRQLSAHNLIYRTYQQLSEQAAISGVDLIVWPEYALPVDVVNHNAGLRARLEQLSARLDTPVVVGSLVIDGDSENHFDSALVFEAGKLEASYNSRFPAFFNRFTVADDTGLRLVELNTSSLVFGPVICYEETLSSLFADYANIGAPLFVSLSNNQDLGLGRALASRYGQLRAGETARYLVRAANDGATLVVDSLGRVTQRIPEERVGVLIAEVALNQQTTLFTRFGQSCLLLLVVCLSLITSWAGRGPKTLNRL